MTAVPVSGQMEVAEAERLVVNRLGRRPQDELEASVVLEAWGGVRAPHSLALGAAVASKGVAQDSPVEPSDERGHRPGPDRAERVVLVLGTAAVALLLPALARDLDSDVVERAWALALPPTLGVGWALLRPGGRIRLHGMRPSRPEVLPVVAVAVAGAAAAALGAAGLVGALLLFAWSSVAILARLGSGRKYTALLVGTGLAGAAGGPALPLLAVVAVAGLTIVAVRLHELPPTRDALTTWLSNLAAAVIGACLGWLVVIDATVRTGGDLPSLVVWAPAAVGVLLAALHLTKLRDAIAPGPWPVTAESDEGDAPRPGPLRLLGAAVTRFVVATAALSTAVVVVGGQRGDALGPAIDDLTRAALLGAVALFVMLLDALGRGLWALAVVLLAAVGDAVAKAGGGDAGDETAWLLAGGGLALVIAVTATLELLCRGDRTTPALLIR